MFLGSKIPIYLLTFPLLLASHSHAQQTPDSIAPNDVRGIVGGSPNLVLDQAAKNNFDECISDIGISASKDLETLNREIAECQERARQESAPISEEALQDYKQQLEEKVSPQQGVQ